MVSSVSTPSSALTSALTSSTQSRPQISNVDQLAKALIDGGEVTSPRGWRASTGSYHAGIDVGVAGNQPGAPIKAIAGGTVIRSDSEMGGYGKTVIIKHSDGKTTLYAHCQDLNVQKGQQIQGGQQIATMGGTGGNYTPHLHFELRNETAGDGPGREHNTIDLSSQEAIAWFNGQPYNPNAPTVASSSTGTSSSSSSSNSGGGALSSLQGVIQAANSITQPRLNSSGLSQPQVGESVDATA
jgi:murein DD-endopeptidase MepM/ murein hydrolase activator NlpD